MSDRHTSAIREPIEAVGQVVARFDGGRMSSDGGALLLQTTDRVLEVVGRMAARFDDYRDPGRTEHGLESLLRQRVFGIGMGYEDLSDHDQIRRDSVLALAYGRDDLTGQKRARARDREYPLAGSSTLNRLELGTPGSAENHRYKKIVADPATLDALLVDLFLEEDRCGGRGVVPGAHRRVDGRVVEPDEIEEGVLASRG